MQFLRLYFITMFTTLTNTILVSATFILYKLFWFSRLWMASAARDLSNYQWRLVSNAIGSCSLPIFVKLVFAEVIDFLSFATPTSTSTYLNYYSPVTLKSVTLALPSVIAKPVSPTLLLMPGNACGCWRMYLLMQSTTYPHSTILLTSHSGRSLAHLVIMMMVVLQVCRWRSYTKPQDTHLASTVMDSIMMLFERIEKQVRMIFCWYRVIWVSTL